MDLGEIDWIDVDWIGLAQDRDKWTALVNAVMKLPNTYTTGVHSNSAQFSSQSVRNMLLYSFIHNPLTELIL
jgi:hypothetical protein